MPRSFPDAATPAATPYLGGPDELDVRDYLRVLTRRKRTVIASVLIFVGGALAVSFVQTSRYEAKAELALEASPSARLFGGTPGAGGPVRSPQTEVKVIESDPLQRRVEEALGFEVPEVDASVVGDADLIEVSAGHTDAEQAALITNAYVNAYIDFRRTQDVGDLAVAAEQTQKRIDELQARIEAIDSGEVLPPAGGRNGEGGGISEAVLAERFQLAARQADLLGDLDRLQVSAELNTGGVQIVSPAPPPSSRSGLTPVRSSVLAGVMGLGLGIALAFLLNWFDDSVRGRGEIGKVTGGAPVLGLIPVVAASKRPDQRRIETLEHPDGAAAESYRALRTSVQFLGLEHKLRSVQVTSPAGGEGRTTTVANLAVLFAQAGHRVAVLDGDLRQPRIHELFGLPNDVGFTSVVLGEASLSEALQDVPAVPGLSLLASGPVPPLPAELLSSPSTGEVIDALENDFDLVIVDSPPVVPTTDACVLTLRVDGVLLVATVDRTSRHELRRAAEILSQVEAPLLGTVLNRADPEAAYAEHG